MDLEDEPNSPPLYNLDMAEEWLTTAEAAELSGYHPEYIRDLMRDGKIDGRKFGIVWQVQRQSLLSYLRMMKEMGERRGPKPSQSETSQS
jgi:excisionase family DNA binding protein